MGRKLFRRLVVAIEEFRFAKASESNAIYKDRYSNTSVTWPHFHLSCVLIPPRRCVASSAHTLGSYVPGDDDVADASSDPYGDHAEPKNVTDHYRWHLTYEQ